MAQLQVFGRMPVLIALSMFVVSIEAGAAQAVKSLPSDTPKKFTPVETDFDFTKREVMIPMRDGVKLKTVILIAKGASDAPILLNRTPYNASARVSRFDSPRLAAVVPDMNDTAVEAGYIIVYQDVRGKYGSEGDYVMARPLRGPLNPTTVDHSTDAYDTIEWLVKNVPESNGRVGMMGGSYEGFTTVMGTVNPHPALKAVVPFSSMIDGWMGDDWFHHGAFRQGAALEFIYMQETARGSGSPWWTGEYDMYDMFLRAGSAGVVAKSRGLEQLGFWRQLSEHPTYDEWWQLQAVDKLLSKMPLTVPMMIVGGLFDQDDTYGSPALFKALAPRDPNGQSVHLVLGPWNHGQSRREGRALGQLQFEGDTAGSFRRKVMQPWLDHYLKDAPKPATPRVLVYETGQNEWRQYDNWPRVCAESCADKSRSLYLLSGGRLGFDAPAAGDDKYDEYVSDPAKPVPYARRPNLKLYDPQSDWGEWLVDDQRHAATRTDVLVYQTEPLKEPLRIAGQPIAHLFASTSGTDSDWVVKIIDVWPDEVPKKPALGGFQQMLSADIFRGRYRTDFSKAQALASNETLPYSIPLPQANHTFLPGHRIMVQIQSSWFPLYDRNPQRFVPNIMFAKPEDFVKATQRVWRTPGSESSVELPVLSQ